MRGKTDLVNHVLQGYTNGHSNRVRKYISINVRVWIQEVKDLARLSPWESGPAQVSFQQEFLFFGVSTVITVHAMVANIAILLPGNHGDGGCGVLCEKFSCAWHWKWS